MNGYIMEFARKYYEGGNATMIPVAKPLSASKEEIEMAKIVIPISKEEMKEVEKEIEEPPIRITIEKDIPVKPHDIKIDIDLEPNRENIPEKKITKAEELPIPSIEHIDDYISKCSNAIRSYLVKGGIFDKVKKFVSPSKINSEYFYKRIQNCIYHTLRAFCGVIVTPGKDTVYTKPEKDSPFNETVRFLNNIMDPELKLTKNGDKFLYGLIESYREKTHSLDGIQDEWFDNLRTALANKFSSAKSDGLALRPEAIEIIANFIKEEWGDKAPLESPVVEEEVKLLDENSEEEAAIIKVLQDVTEETNKALESYEGHDENCSCEECMASDDEAIAPLEVIVDESGVEGYDVISILNNTHSPYSNQFPFVVKLDELEKMANEYPITSINGIWDWIQHVAKPILVFRTHDIEKFTSINTNPNLSGFKILDIDTTDSNDSKGTLMGLYSINDEIGDTEENSDTLIKEVNYLVMKYIANTPFSVYPLTSEEAKDSDSLFDESEVMKIFQASSEEDTEDEDLDLIEDNGEEVANPELSDDVISKIIESAASESEESEEFYQDDTPEEYKEESPQVVLNENGEVVSDSLPEESPEEYESLDEAQYMKEAEENDFTFKVRHKKKIEDF